MSRRGPGRPSNTSTRAPPGPRSPQYDQAQDHRTEECRADRGGGQASDTGQRPERVPGRSPGRARVVGEGKRTPQLQLLLAPQLRDVPVQHKRAPHPGPGDSPFLMYSTSHSLLYPQGDDNNPHRPGPTTLNTYPIGPWHSFVRLKEGEYPSISYPLPGTGSS